MAVFKLVLLRHGESLWNDENRFTGWVDVPLTDKGRQEARRAAALLRENGLEFDAACTSVLTRAIHTLWIVLDELQLQWLPEEKNWRLNERHYGALQGLNKAETAERMGQALVQTWRKSYDVPPPAIHSTADPFSGYDARYAGLAAGEFPGGESLKMTAERLLSYWQQSLVPRIRRGERLLVIAHRNSIRALVRHLSHLSDQEVMDVQIPTGIPLVYEFDENMAVERRYFLDKDVSLIAH
ncbi:2,3-diphosphoglycerate-dependent phosphoglycerate mutase [Affinibrenneria salicis]|uniref:2,3-bisphosphoglycerate-dependent phosphoglycerate mutase n=1 Tax=Affinibrenneria salicis TaxID=2590031 RepID=A0A5J5G1D0_9GAMM|nr:2,3-diphosphoglycerate-dependent phosphoglycerate mutase [Affinibrenneria salicis]KAA9000524.1 2,3-diphosphoglycerate-dependent phosphoglycerate mutase [Affinibrenneria salicis]